MRMSSIYIGLLLVAIFACSNTSSEADYNKLMKGLKALSAEGFGGDDVIVVINMKGCSACYSKALNFLKKYSDLDHIHYFITGVESQKNLKIRLGSDVFNSSKVHIDGDQILLHQGLNYAYPLIFYRNNGDLVRMEIADVEKGIFAFDDLHQHLSR